MNQDAHHELEEGLRLQLDFQKLSAISRHQNAVVPVVVQDMESREVLILAYANAEALSESLRQKKAVFWSTSRQELWVKGATSGSALELVEVRVNCEQNSLLYLVRAPRGACHTKDGTGSYRHSCYYRSLGESTTADLCFTAERI
ncbi:MAG: phosphoribosyl-AMP cyclohydrolase [Leptospiraceae bacterium]|nr:phosphoribosyl-AMP cyclohydrolase [Leptospiraceae bacterium]